MVLFIFGTDEGSHFVFRIQTEMATTSLRMIDYPHMGHDQSQVAR